jgi:hypothetical protein
MMGEGQSMEQQPMSAAENKKLVQQVYADAANRSGTTFVDNLADDASWIVTGQYSWSHQFRGRDGILNGLMGHFRSFFAERPRTVGYNFIADGESRNIATRRWSSACLGRFPKPASGPPGEASTWIGRCL